MAKISIIGAGSWGTALGLLLCNNGHDVTICSENEKEIEVDTNISDAKKRFRKANLKD